MEFIDLSYVFWEIKTLFMHFYGLLCISLVFLRIEMPLYYFFVGLDVTLIFASCISSFLPWVFDAFTLHPYGTLCILKHLTGP